MFAIYTCILSIIPPSIPKQILEAPMTTLSDEFLIPGTNKGIFYGGKFQKPNHSAVIKVLNPAKAQLFTTVP